MSPGPHYFKHNMHVYEFDNNVNSILYVTIRLKNFIVNVWDDVHIVLKAFHEGWGGSHFRVVNSCRALFTVLCIVNDYCFVFAICIISAIHPYH